MVDRRVSLEQVDWRRHMEHIQQGDEVGSLNMQDTPQDASATMCLVVQSSDLEEKETLLQFYGHHWEQRDRVREQQKEQGGIIR